MDESPFKLVINKTAFLGINFECDHKNRLQIYQYDEISPEIICGAVTTATKIIKTKVPPEQRAQWNSQKNKWNVEMSTKSKRKKTIFWNVKRDLLLETLATTAPTCFYIWRKVDEPLSQRRDRSLNVGRFGIKFQCSVRMSLDLNGSLNSQQHAGQQERKSSTQSELHVKT